MNYLNDKAYNILKWCGLVVCPALAVFIQTVGEVWGMPYAHFTIHIRAAGRICGG